MAKETAKEGDKITMWFEALPEADAEEVAKELEKAFAFTRVTGEKEYTFTRSATGSFVGLTEQGITNYLVDALETNFGEHVIARMNATINEHHYIEHIEIDGTLKKF